MDKYKVPYLNLVVRKFAERYRLSLSGAFAYLMQYGGMAYLSDFYDIEHTLSLEDTLDELQSTCYAAGGAIE